MMTQFRIVGIAILLSCTTVQAIRSIQIIRGVDCAAHMKHLIELRLEAFKEFPYLYVGNEDWEKIFVGDYPDSPETIFVFTYEEKDFAGVLTGTPFQAICRQDVDARVAFEQAGRKISDYYYLSEVITLKTFRNKGVASNNFKVMEEHVKKLGYKYACFLTSEREENHPQKPEGYKGPTSLFQKLGYTKTDIRVSYVWPTIQSDGSVKDVENIVAYWVKEL